MTESFDRLLRDAAPAVPDCGDGRRLVISLIHERIRQESRPRRTAYAPGVAIAASLVLFFLTIGQPQNLGSDGGEYDARQYVDPLTGVHYIQQTVGSVKVSGATPEEAQRMHEAALSGQVPLRKMFGTEIGDEYQWWGLGDEIIDGVKTPVTEYDLPCSKEETRLNAFLASGAYRRYARLQRELPPDEVRDATIGGYRVRLMTWIFEDPELGTIRLSEGIRLDDDATTD